MAIKMVTFPMKNCDVHFSIVMEKHLPEGTGSICDSALYFSHVLTQYFELCTFLAQKNVSGPESQEAKSDLIRMKRARAQKAEILAC